MWATFKTKMRQGKKLLKKASRKETLKKRQGKKLKKCAKYQGKKLRKCIKERNLENASRKETTFW